MFKICVTYESGLFIVNGEVGLKVAAKLRGSFEYNPLDRRYQTKSVTRASRFLDYFDEKALARYRLNRFVPDLPAREFIVGLDKLYEYQKEAVKWALTRNHFYIALEQGLGKTLVAITLLKNIEGPSVVVCPPFLIENWKREIAKWGGPKMTVLSYKEALHVEPPKITLVSDTMLLKKEVKDLFKKNKYSALLGDEAHRYKTPDAHRTIGFFRDLSPLVQRVGLLSGTPMPNRPIELFPALSYLAVNLIDSTPDYRSFGVRYANGFMDQFGHWDYSGASNLEELKKRIEPFMFRKTKADVLKELKGKIVEKVFLEPKAGLRDARTRLKALSEKYGTIGEIIKNQRLGDIAKARENLGFSKVDAAVEFIKSGERVPTLVFAWHKDTISKLADRLGVVTPIVGSLPVEKREAVIKDFMGGRTNILIANLKTMVGYNLTRATRVVFVEFSWSPADNEQAEDRAHRIGQDEILLVQYLIAPGTLDEQVIDSLNLKKRNIDKLIN